MLGPLIVNFDHATRDGVVEGSLALSDLDGVEVKVGDPIGVMDSGAGPYEAEVVEVDGDRIRVRAPALSVPRSRPGLADAEDIERWAATYRARSQLPELVRRLLADTPGVTLLSIRAGTGVDHAGWDGSVDGGVGAPYVPAGPSFWEMSTSQDPGDQAQRNYRKRTEEPEAAEPGTTTFVFVTPRRWSGKDRWEQSRRAKGVWRDVRVLDVDDLAGWLESRYSVHVWLSEQLGLRPGEVETLERWWSRWSVATEPPLPEDLLLAGRTDKAKALCAELGGNPSVTGIRAGSRDEAIAFAAAALRSLEDRDHPSRSFVVASAVAWDNSVSTHGRSVLIPTFDRADVVAAVSAGHHVVVPMGVDDPGQAISLPRIGRSEARAAFENIGFDSHRAEHLAVRARRSLTSLRRALSVDPRAARPGWAQGEDGDILAVLVLVGAWSGNREADQEIVSEILSRDYELVERLLRRWENTGDPPFRRSGNSWRLSNPEDAWVLLNDLVVGADLERWGKVVLRVLGTRDPVLDMDPKDRFMASVRGEEQRWSFDLRRGLAQGLALLASPGLPRAINWQIGADHTGILVRELLARAGKDETGKLWQQLSGVLPLLAEADPEEFLDAVRRDSVGEDPLIRNMFTERPDLGSPWNETSAHTGLLWALETLCWSPDHLLEALDLLMRLAEIDPGGRLANRPIASATKVLLPWRPQTSTDPNRRLEILEGLLSRHDDRSQELVAGLLSTRSTSLNTHQPRFKDWVPHDRRVMVEQFEEEKRGIVDRLLVAIQHSPSKFIVWIDQLPQLAEEAQQGILGSLENISETELADHDRLLLWETLNNVLNRYQDETVLERWLFPGGLQILKDITAELEPEAPLPTSSIEKAEAKSLFGWGPVDEGVREDTVKSAYKAGGIGALLALTERAECTTSVGITAAGTLDDSILLDLLKLVSASECGHELAMSWIRQRADTQGVDWIGEMSSRLLELRAEVQAMFFRSVRPESRIWELLDQGEAIVRETYWSTVNHWTVPLSDVSAYVSYLIRFGRPWLAVCAAAVGTGDNTSYPISVENVEKVLATLLRSQVEPALSSSNIYYVGKLLDILDSQKPDSEVLRLVELAFFHPLQTIGRTPNAVYRWLEEDPECFVDLVNRLNSQSEEAGERLFVSYDVAWSLLHEWKTVPGTDASDGRINYSTLRDWVIEARRLFEECQWTDIGDMYIGELLAASITGRDGVWPAEEVRRILEELGSDAIDEGFVSRARNLVELPIRGLYEGGTQERHLAERYGTWARELDYRWPRTGRVLREISASYKSYAIVADGISERFADLD